MSNSLKGKTIVITGSGRSIGREMAIRVAAAGASVALLEINRENLEEVRSTIAAAGGDAIEVISPQQTPVQKRELWALCQLHGLTASVGSDFHQATTWNDIGKNLYLTDDVLPVWANWPLQATA